VAQSTVRLIVDAQNAIAPLKRVNDATRNLNKNTNQLKNRLNEGKRSLDRFGNSAKQSSRGVNTLVGTIRKLAAAFAILQVGKFVIFQTAELERQRKSLEVLTGSVADTNAIIAELKAFGAVTPFKASELIETTKRLKAFGFETDKLVDTTKRISDVAGATGADLDGIATAFGQIQAKGKLQQEENLQLLERGVDITTELKNITGLQGDAFADAMRKGKIGADLVNQALINLTNEGGAFFGGASAQSTTLAGKFSTLQDGIETLAQNVGEKLEPALKSALDIAINLVNRINQAIVSGTITDTDKKAFQKQAQGIVQEQAGGLFGMVGGPFGMGEVSVDFAGETFKGQPASVQSQITNALINQEVAKRLQKQLEVQKQLEKSTNIVKENNKENAIAIENIGFTFSEGLVPNTGFFAENLDLSKAFVNDINLGSIKISDSFKHIKNDAELLNEKFAEIGQTIGSQISDALVGAINGTKSLGEAAKGIINDLANSLLRLGINTLLKSTGFGIFSNLPGFANGGRPPVGRPSIVGERGPEIFVPSSAGTIIANDKIGGSTNNVVVNVDASGSAVEGDDDNARQLGQLIAVAVQSELIQQKRPGGLLA
jgi:tape measure domain-containing protein